MTKKQTLARRIVQADRLYYGWIILAASFLSVFFSAPGQTYFTSVFIESYVKEFGWSRSALSSMYSAATILSGTLLFFVGRLADKYGQKKILLIAITLIGFSSFWTSNVTMLWMIFVGFFVGRITGQGTMTMIPAIVLPGWFHKRRALAFSLMAMGGAAGSAIVPPFNAYLINLIGWRMTWRVWMLIMWLVLLPIMVVFFRNKPEDVGLSIEDEQKQRAKKDSFINRIFSKTTPGVSKKSIHAEVNFDARQAVRTSAFWGTVFVQMLFPMIGTGLTFHFVSVMTQRGVDEVRTPFLLSIIAVTTLISSLLNGFIFTKISAKTGSVLIAINMSAAVIIVLAVNSFPAAVFYALIQGYGNGMMAVWGGIVWPEYFGTRHLGSIRGLATTCMVIASALGPLPLGLSFDYFGRHEQALYFFLAMSLTGIVVALLCKRPKPPIRYKNEY